MLDISSGEVKEKLLSGEFGLEMEGLRTDGEGYFAHTPHPFPDNKHIVRDFCENQTEINTGVEKARRQWLMNWEDIAGKSGMRLAKCRSRNCFGHFLIRRI